MRLFPLRWTWLALGALLATTGCATLNTAGMSEPCKRLYNACLNGCPNAAAPSPAALNSMPVRTDVAQCVDECNKQAKSCQ
jgi:hypothetical protein